LNDLKVSEELEKLKEMKRKCHILISEIIFNFAEKYGMIDVKIPLYYKRNDKPECSNIYFIVRNNKMIWNYSWNAKFFSDEDNIDYSYMLDNLKYSIERERDYQLKKFQKEQEDCIEFLKQFGENE
jgi:hypothetical protein